MSGLIVPAGAAVIVLMTLLGRRWLIRKLAEFEQEGD